MIGALQFGQVLLARPNSFFGLKWDSLSFPNIARTIIPAKKRKTALMIIQRPNRDQCTRSSTAAKNSLALGAPSRCIKLRRWVMT